MDRRAYPDLAPSNYHLFAPFKGALRGREFSSVKAVHKAVHEWLCDRQRLSSYMAFTSLSTAGISALKLVEIT